jgi:hypothetical protein
MLSPESSRPSRLKCVSPASALLVALIIPAGIIYLQHQLQARPNDMARPWDDPKVSKKLADGRLAKAKAIRAEWLPWAKAHQTELRAMLASGGKDFSRAEAVYKVSPPLRFEDWRPDTQSGPAHFGWLVDVDKMTANGERIQWFDAKSKAAYEEGRGQTEKKLRQEFADQSDFTVATSVNPGPTETQFWASGRITETTVVPNTSGRSGDPAFIKLAPKELVPPYEFLLPEGQ